MIIPRRLGERIKISPPSTELFELLHNISMFLIMDDKHDLGRFTYYDRHEHYYQGKHSPHHPTPWHHWQIGALGLMVSQIGALMSKGVEMYNDYKDAESGVVEMDADLNAVFEDNTISLESYKEEVSNLPSRSEVQEQPKVYSRKPNSPPPPSLTVPELPNLIGLAC